MPPILGPKSGDDKLGVARIAQCIFGLSVIGTSLWYIAHFLQDHVDQYPKLVGVYPVLGLLSLILSLPFIFYLGFFSEFSHLSPLKFKDYMFLLKRILNAAAAQNANRGKVQAKDL